MRKTAITAIVLALAAATAASAHHEMENAAGPAAKILTSLPDNAWTITEWYKRDIYDTADNKIGDIKDVLLDHDGKTAAIIIGVGGFLGVGEKDVAVPYDAVLFKRKDNNGNWYPVMNTTKDALENAPGYKYDRSAVKWVPDTATTQGQGNRPEK